ncbi:MAG: agmatine deiminase [Desulfobacterales bacterium]
MSTTLNSHPRNDGFRMPGEFEPHQGCWMLWPERGDTWRLSAGPAQASFAAVAAAISRFEPVTVGVSARRHENARRLLPDHVQTAEIDSDDAWMRDVGPTFVINDDTRKIRGIDWRFNAWGGREKGLYYPWDRDEQVARKVLELERMRRYRAPFILEGGAIHVDGQGTLITTESCLLNINRNPSLSKEQLEAYLKSFLNVDKIIWIPEGVYLDETDGHVDNLCCFVKPGVVALTWTDDPEDPQRKISEQAFDILSRATDARERSLSVHKIHQPGPLFMTDAESRGLDTCQNARPRKAGDRLAGSYINFYMSNGGIVMPLFGDVQDAEAQQALQALFPDRAVIGVQAREILLGGGCIHCITQQVPAV